MLDGTLVLVCWQTYWSRVGYRYCVYHNIPLCAVVLLCNPEYCSIVLWWKCYFHNIVWRYSGASVPPNLLRYGKFLLLRFLSNFSAKLPSFRFAHPLVLQYVGAIALSDQLLYGTPVLCVVLPSVCLTVLWCSCAIHLIAPRLSGACVVHNKRAPQQTRSTTKRVVLNCGISRYSPLSVLWLDRQCSPAIKDW